MLYEGRSGTRGTGCTQGHPTLQGTLCAMGDALQGKKPLVPGGIGLAASLLASPDPIQGNHANVKHPTAGNPGGTGGDCASLACHTPSDKQQWPLGPQEHRVCTLEDSRAR